MSRVLMIDNYDSFTYNLVQYLQEEGADVTVVRNDAVKVAEIDLSPYDRIMLSPGPGRPADAGICLELIRAAAGKKPIFGVCLGHQAIVEAFGGNIVSARQIMHGKVSRVEHDSRGIFAGLPSPLTATRYHSLVAEQGSVPGDFIVTARSEDGEIMGVRHKSMALEGVQFHPESILTEKGHEMIRNFLGDPFVSPTDKG